MTLQTTSERGQTRAAAWASRAKSLVPADRSPFVFNALVVFSFLYYYRPEDYLSFLVGIPMARVAALLALVALIVGMSSGKVKMPGAVKILWLLLLQMTLCIPFAMWMGGAFHTVYEKFAKGVIAAMLISMSVVTVRELRRLIWIQVSAVALVTFFSIALRHYNKDCRLQGIQKSILENPNDLAINIAISFPLGLALMLSARGVWKVIWAVALAVMSLGLVLTYSRSGLLAFMIVIIVCVWEYGIKGKRRSLVIVTAITMILGMCAALSTSHYRARVASIVMGNIEGSGDKGFARCAQGSVEEKHHAGLESSDFWSGPGLFRAGRQGLGRGSQQLHRISRRGRDSCSGIVSHVDLCGIPECWANPQVGALRGRSGSEAFHASPVGGLGGISGGCVFRLHRVQPLPVLHGRVHLRHGPDCQPIAAKAGEGQQEIQLNQNKI